ncbi:spermidine/putrescine ABC transporter permease [Brenneria goodwinii]|uniref:Spermidine/putrescine ABC transporter permease n=1 Tax=Brenneria goodwinii TaxID=1109412 RepID=A0AAE8EQ92_9GAMM|nr:ABC transporter permease [Brenneria goodwinii]ATA24684.1 spermidine/putrescine ABC transporter permease [Brenneria goodwinii]MCG8158747.1 ABC transporter permease [Brenneria goodwinii]MCG8163238.1 ABC transporter permease [Brenneria goodwinii]MCG8167659.1 ABC transporter permease [Brenneria goodwinii]MCG8170565.1 ABC transporter permease [Brenneria goodwinii]
MSEWKKSIPLIGLLSPVTLLLAICLFIPLAIMVVFSILTPGMYGGVEWSYYSDNYGRILGWADGTQEEFDILYLKIILTSFRIALMSVVISLIICYPIAFWVRNKSPRIRNFLLFLITLPFFASLIVRLYAWVLILRPTGFLNTVLQTMGVIARPLDLIYTEQAVLIGMAYIYIPFMFLPVYASVERLDHHLIEASYDLGANRVKTFFRVIFPLTLPGVISGSIMVFIPSLGNFIVPSLLGGAKVVMIGSLIEQQFLSARNWPFGAALAMLLMSMVLFALLLYLYLSSRYSHAGAGGISSRRNDEE